MTDFTAAAEEALNIARERHNAILAGDFERYEALFGALEDACAALADVAGQDANAGVFDELSALETASLRALQDQASEVSGRLGDLASRGRSSRAYALAERGSVNGL